MRILVADHDPCVRAALRMLLIQEPGEADIAESADLDGFVMRICEFRPELVLLEWELPGRAAAALLFAFTRLDFRPRLVVLSRRAEARKAALAIGADGFVYKGGPPEELLLACRSALNYTNSGPHI